MARSKIHTRAVHTHAYKKMMKHTFCLTDRSHLGIASDNVKDGDDAILIAGLNLPMILNPTADENPQVFGPAYIGGVIYGEFSSEKKLQFFELA